MSFNYKNFLYLFFIFICLTIVADACKQNNEAYLNDDKLTINLKWNKAYTTETKQMVETGLLWSFSFFGANLPRGSFNESKVWNNNIVTINLNKLGFNTEATTALSKLVVAFKQSEEYKKKGAIDIGRFIALTVNSSNHYYAITGISKTFHQFKIGKVFDSKQFLVTNSSISSHDRLIDLPDSNNLDYRKDAYVSNECEGRISEGKNKITSFEVTEQMKNGQFRYAIYDTLGFLLTAANGAAGKPAKCLWCHETNIQTLFTNQVDEPGYYGAEQFKYIISRNTITLNNYRNSLQSDIDFIKKQDHTQIELLYISFMETSAERLSNEWGISIIEIETLLAGIKTHDHDEFTFLKNLYYRKEIEKFAPFSSLRAPDSAREISLYEPNLIY